MHPYGSVGSLFRDNHVQFGGRNRSLKLIDIANQIKTFTERVDDDAIRDGIREIIEEAKQIVFLGFAFHPLNMELITPTDGSKAHRVLATTVGISPSDSAVVEADIRHMLEEEMRGGVRVILNALSCAEFIPYHWRTLSRG